jgi:adenylate kinase family enzyme
VIASTVVILYNAEVNIGHRIVVFGPSGSGKSTLAERIARQIGVPYIELDAIYWKPDWVESPKEEFRVNVSAVLEKCTGGWVIDGNYSMVRDLTVPLADTIIWFCPPFPVAFWRLLKRTVTRSRNHTLMWGTNRETWRQSFFSRNSILLYQILHWNKFKKVIPSLEKIPHRAPVVSLRSQNEAETFLKGID